MNTFLTSQEMQELINVDRSTVYRMAEDGRLPGVKVGRQWRFPADRVAAQLGLAIEPVSDVKPGQFPVTLPPHSPATPRPRILRARRRGPHPAA